MELARNYLKPGQTLVTLRAFVCVATPKSLATWLMIDGAISMSVLLIALGT